MKLGSFDAFRKNLADKGSGLPYEVRCRALKFTTIEIRKSVMWTVEYITVMFIDSERRNLTA